MAADFDPDDRDSWYFGFLSRQEAADILEHEKDSGVFLVRDSSTIRGDFVLCVKEDNKISHYIINKIQGVGGVARFRIGDQEFPDLPSLLNFYKTHYLDTTSLIRPAPRGIIKVKAKFDFPGKDPEDLPFKKGDILTIIRKDEDQWWTAMNSEGTKGQIPVPYVQKIDPSVEVAANHFPVANAAAQPANPAPDYRDPKQMNGTQPIRRDIQLPCFARVIQRRIPNAYDHSALKLEEGDIVKVNKMNMNGIWEGELNGKSGNFPFRYVKLIDKDDPDNPEDEHLVK
ncbi:adapter molecule Crk [Lingula anatina]|uniref:Adapter molecule Crk n=1 Tax=Lingula anatina TaxID=7574 RepID=A0A1S3HHJ2_LINAN|nr:adapter molecule Crk [Lingula anatina]|eukprot:XP_013384956.1 adapter molecule Crk [Lingula anatina]